MTVGKFVYELPDNVVEVHEVFLDDALKLKEHGNQMDSGTESIIFRKKKQEFKRIDGMLVILTGKYCSIYITTRK